MLYVDTSKPVDIPKSVAHCPECKGGLWVEITEWGTDEGDITEGGFEIHCNNEERKPKLHAEYWPSDWMPVEAKVYQWLLDNVRIADATENDLRDWNEAVKDWEACGF